MGLCKWCREVLFGRFTMGGGYMAKPCDYCGCRLAVMPVEVSYQDEERLGISRCLVVSDEVPA
jgi:hypothetical protein